MRDLPRGDSQYCVIWYYVIYVRRRNDRVAVWLPIRRYLLGGMTPLGIAVESVKFSFREQEKKRDHAPIVATDRPDLNVEGGKLAAQAIERPPQALRRYRLECQVLGTRLLLLGISVNRWTEIPRLC